MSRAPLRPSDGEEMDPVDLRALERAHAMDDAWDSGMEDPSFGELLGEQLRKTPWFIISVAVHALIALVLSFVGTTERESPPPATVEVAAPERVEEAPPPPPVEEERPEVDPDPEPTKDPLVEESPVDEVVQTDNDQDAQEALGEVDAPSDQPFDATSSNNSIGLGGPPGGAFGSRIGGARDGRGQGISPRTERAVAGGLAWLADHQSPDGSWDCDQFMAQGDPERGPLCEGQGSAAHDVGVSGLALLCFLGAGHDHTSSTYGGTVRRGLVWLMAQQDHEGCFGPRAAHQWIYSHAIATLAMCEAYGLSQSAIFKESAQKSIEFVVKAQNPYAAWRYGVKPGNDDSSVTGWMVMALKAAQAAGLEVGDTSMTWALDFIDTVTAPDTGRTGYTKRGELPVRAEGRQAQFPASESESLTAVGILCRIFAGEDPADSAAIQAGAELIVKKLPVWDVAAGKVDMYYWYYATLAMFQVGASDPGKWKSWNAKMKAAIVERQRTDGNYAGSWDPVGPWGEDGGRVYSTATMTLCMMVYYRYGRVFGAR